MRERLHRIWPSLLALVATVGVVAALLVMFGDDTGDSMADDPDSIIADGDENGDAEGDESGDPSDEGDAGDDAGADEQPGDETGDDAGDESTEDGEAADDGDDSTDEPGDGTPAPEELRTPVGIANQTAVEGLEIQAQERLQQGGWEVAATSGFNGTVPETTVYFPPGMEESAEALSQQFPEIGRVMPTFEGLSQDRLVIILVDDYVDDVDG